MTLKPKQTTYAAVKSYSAAKTLVFQYGSVRMEPIEVGNSRAPIGYELTKRVVKQSRWGGQYVAYIYRKNAVQSPRIGYLMMTYNGLLIRRHYGSPLRFEALIDEWYKNAENPTRKGRPIQKMYNSYYTLVRSIDDPASYFEVGEFIGCPALFLRAWFSYQEATR